jgi:hypothetical protein
MPLTIRKRKTKRSRVLLNVRLEGAVGQQEVHIRDLSSEGALIEASSPPSVGEEVKLSYGDACIKAKVAWSDGSTFGVEFAEPLTGTILAVATENRLKVSAPKSYRHGKMPEAEKHIDVSPRVISLRSKTV